MRNRRDLSALLKVPPLAVLPWISTAADLRANVVTRRLSIVAVMALLAAGVALIHFFYRPLDVLWQVAARWVGA